MHQIKKYLSAFSLLLQVSYQLVRKIFGFPFSSNIHMIVEGADWTIDRVGHYIEHGVKEQFGQSVHLFTSLQQQTHQVIHFGSLWTFLVSANSPLLRYNKVVTTLFHGKRDQEFPDLAVGIDELLHKIELIDYLVTASRIMESRLLSWGVPKKKIARIPLGVDTNLFQPLPLEYRSELRAQLGIPDQAFIIGSFHKDGNGWEEGLTPKLVKGPDIFLDVIKQLAKENQVFVLLSGPARGYVKKGLDQLNVPYLHKNLEEYEDIVGLYQCLDAYLVASREEGGPLAVLESLATGVPLVSTRVGLAPDVIADGVNGLLADREDVDQLAKHVTNLIESTELRKRLVAAGLDTIPAYDWKNIARQYYERVYQPLLEELQA